MVDSRPGKRLGVSGEEGNSSSVPFTWAPATIPCVVPGSIGSAAGRVCLWSDFGSFSSTLVHPGPVWFALEWSTSLVLRGLLVSGVLLVVDVSLDE